MKIAVWDTYVTKTDNTLMHFDILVPDEINKPDIIFGYGKEYLKYKGQQDQPLSATECTFCHIEEATTDMITSIGAKGYHIIEIQGCD